jgi:uncharacterized protein
MEKVKLGRTKLVVSRLCFGSLTVGPLQADLTIEEGARVIANAFDSGVNFIDTAKLYKTYPYIRRAMELSKNKEIIISSKSYDYTYEGMKESLREALEELGLKKLGIFSLHEQESKHTLRGHEEALEYLIEAKKQGLIEAIGVSTHAIEVVRAICNMDCIDVIHPIINAKGLGIMDGNIDEMLEAIKEAYQNAKGIYGMKILGGGNLMGEALKCIDYALSIPYLHSIAIGMQTLAEVEANIEIFEGRKPQEGLIKKLSSRTKKLHVDFWCEGCMRCCEACKNGALSLIDGKAVVDKDKCVLCGYCSAYCPLFCIKIV